MKKTAVLGFSILFSAACAGGGAVNSEQAANAPMQSANNSLTVSSRSQPIRPENPLKADSTSSAPNPNQKSGQKSKWTQSGDPIETAQFDEEIAKAEKNLKAKPNDEAAKKLLAESYFKRGFALTEARQYASALGDYRKALKLDPTSEDAKTWIKRIVEIYDGLNKEYPKEGEEPPALPFKKEKT